MKEPASFFAPLAVTADPVQYPAMNFFGKPSSTPPAYNGPTGFHWLMPGLLGGTPRPGIFKDIERDLQALQRVGTRLLVTLTEEWQPDATLIKEYDMQSLYVPIPDLHPPSLAQAEHVCEIASAFTRRGEAVVFHCHAGKGRTGTLLAAMLIHTGRTAAQAIAETRRQNRQWIESESQLAFLEDFAAHQRL